jgi:hypothetical protein
MINSLEDLEKLLILCRAQGVTEINLGTVSLKLGELPVDMALLQAQYQEQGEGQMVSYDQSALDRMVGMPINPTDEQLMDMFHPLEDNIEPLNEDN